MRYFEMFAGVGGFGIGIQQAYENNPEASGLATGQETTPRVHGNSADDTSEHGRHGTTCIGFSEIDPHASNVLRYHYPNIPNYGDCTKINWSEVPDFDLLLGGSPCQDFSIAGKRAGIEGKRSGLVWEYIRCLEEKKPRYFIFENVKGLLSSGGGRHFATILTAFSEAGYSLWWQVLNAKDFGVPQNRERIFIVGTRTDLGSPREVFFVREDDIIPVSSNGTDIPQSQADAAQTVRTKIGTRADDSFVVAGTIDHDSFRKTKDEALNLPATYYKGPDNHGARTVLKANEQIRRLTPKECERLMSWPDGHTKYGINEKDERVEISDTQRYKMCGNGVVSKVVAEVFNQIICQKKQ